MTRLSSAMGLAAATALMAGSGAPPAAARQPVKPWVLDYGETACTAIRDYGSGQAPLTVAFRPSPGAAVVRLAIARRGRLPVPFHFPVQATIGDAAIRTTGLRFGSEGFDVAWINFDRASLESIREAGEIALAGGGTLTDRFALPGFAAVLKALDKCNADLRSHWNVGEAAATPVATPARSKKPLAHYFSSSDYPRQAMDERRGGTAGVTLMIDETGTMRDCLIEQTSGVATLDAMGCLVLQQRARFDPALGADGKPVRSVLTQRIVWRLG